LRALVENRSRLLGAVFYCPQLKLPIFGVDRISLNLSTDFIDKKQTLYGYRTLNSLNSHGDPTFSRTVLYLQAARDYIPAPKANLAMRCAGGDTNAALLMRNGNW